MPCVYCLYTGETFSKTCFKCSGRVNSCADCFSLFENCIDCQVPVVMSCRICGSFLDEKSCLDCKIVLVVCSMCSASLIRSGFKNVK